VFRPVRRCESIKLGGADERRQQGKSMQRGIAAVRTVMQNLWVMRQYLCHYYMAMHTMNFFSSIGKVSAGL
jgi:hypothetical protein